MAAPARGHVERNLLVIVNPVPAASVPEPILRSQPPNRKRPPGVRVSSCGS